jgi:hypothetical protein
MFSYASRGLLLLLFLLAANVAHAQSVQAQPFVPPTRENEKCIVLSRAEYDELKPNHFLKQETLSFDRYKAYRGTIEVVEYNALGSTANPVFTMPRNVTEQDEVVLRLRGNTYAYNYVASYTASDLTQRELLNVLGAGSTKGIFEAQAAAAEATRTNTATEAAKPPAKSAADNAGEFDEDAQAVVDGLESLRGAVRAALTVNEGGLSLAKALVDFEAAVDKLQLEYASAAARVIADPTIDDFSTLRAAQDAAETAASRLPLLLATLRSQTNGVVLKLDQDLPPLKAAIQRMQLPVLLADAIELEAARDRIRNQVTAVSASVTRAMTALASARLDVARFLAAGRQTDICASIGRFRNKSVKVTLTATPVNLPGAATAAGLAAPSTPAAAAGGGTTATGTITRDDAFDADVPTHVHVKLGPVVSTLDDPEFKLLTVTDGCAQGRQCFIPYISATNSEQVRPAMHIALLVPGRYFWTGSDPGDPYETSKRSQWLIPYPTFGFSLTDTTSNVLIGGGIDIGLGIGIQAGLHLGRATRLLPEYRAENNTDGLEGKQFDRPTGTTVAIADVTDKAWRRGYYMSLSIDASTLTRILNLGQGNR